jgi:arylsulfatase A-like enzyme
VRRAEPFSMPFSIAAWCCWWVLAGLAWGETRPNLLIILTDDQGYGDVSAFGGPDVQTLHLDRLASQGLMLESMRANATVCSPSRAALLTGRYADRVGVPGVIRTHPADSWGYLSPHVATLPELLRASGYHTAHIGKWHLGLESPNLPNQRGFDWFHGFLGDMMDSYTGHLRHGNNYLRLNDQEVEAQGHATEIFTDWAIEYLRGHHAAGSQPFFLYLAYNAPHFPIEPPAEWLERVQQRAPQLDEKRAKNVAFVEHLDANIGRLLAVLDELQLTDSTLVAFASDNGGSLPHGQSNDPWRDGKQSHYDGGLRVPMLLRLPGQIPAGSRSDYAGLVFDLFPTCLELAGVDAADDLDAVSLTPLWQGGTMPGDRELYFVRREGGPAYGGNSYETLIAGRWKLTRSSPYQPLELYELENDPYERNNVIDRHPDVARRLGARLRWHIQRGGQVVWQPPASLLP